MRNQKYKNRVVLVTLDYSKVNEKSNGIIVEDFEIIRREENFGKNVLILESKQFGDHRLPLENVGNILLRDVNFNKGISIPLENPYDLEIELAKQSLINFSKKNKVYKKYFYTTSYVDDVIKEMFTIVIPIFVGSDERTLNNTPVWTSDRNLSLDFYEDELNKPRFNKEHGLVEIITNKELSEVLPSMKQELLNRLERKYSALEIEIQALKNKM